MEPLSPAEPEPAALEQTPPIVRVLGTPIAQLALPGLLDYFRQAVRSARKDHRTRLIAYANAHTCNLSAEDAEYRWALQQLDVVYTDGNGPRLAAWLAGSWLPPRMTAADWIYDLCRLSAREGFRLYFLGGTQGVAEQAANRLRSQVPGLSLVGAHDGYFSPEREGCVLQSIRAAAPDILAPGMGTPRQEIWMVRRRDALHVPVAWGAGGVFDYASGRIARPPWWMRKFALEWLGRMMIEPRRLAMRYLVGLPIFLARSLRYGLSARAGIRVSDGKRSLRRR